MLEDTLIYLFPGMLNLRGISWFMNDDILLDE